MASDCVCKDTVFPGKSDSISGKQISSYLGKIIGAEIVRVVDLGEPSANVVGEIFGLQKICAVGEVEIFLGEFFSFCCLNTKEPPAMKSLSKAHNNCFEFAALTALNSPYIFGGLFAGLVV
jgi:hypothetical protein